MDREPDVDASSAAAASAARNASTRNCAADRAADPFVASAPRLASASRVHATDSTTLSARCVAGDASNAAALPPPTLASGGNARR